MDTKVPLSSMAYWNDDRSPIQVELSIRISRVLTQNNLPFIAAEESSHSNKNAKISRQDFLYVCLNGLPPFPNEFNRLQLPGQHFTFMAPAFDPDASETEVRKMRMTWKYSAEKLHAMIMSYPNKPIVFVFHSFGSYFLTKYLQYFEMTKLRVVGWIDIGGSSLRFAPMQKQWLRKYENISFEQFQDNLQQQFDKMNSELSRKKLITHPSKYSTRQFLRQFINNYGFKDMFERFRDSPRVLKCIIFGRKDGVFDEGLQSEKVMHFCSQLTADEMQPYNEAFKHAGGMTTGNAQERFIFDLQHGQHTLHLQRRYQELLPRIISKYLAFIEHKINTSSSKL